MMRDRLVGVECEQAVEVVLSTVDELKERVEALEVDASVTDEALMLLAVEERLSRLEERLAALLARRGC